MNKILLTTLIIAALSFTFCGSGGDTEFSAPGIVDGNILTLKSQVAGRVEAVLVGEGEAVDPGTVIAKIDSGKIENQLKELEITLKEIDINRQKIKKKTGLVRENVRYLTRQVQRFRRLKKSQSLAGEKLENMELRLLEAETSLFDLEKGLDALDIQEAKILNKQEYLALVLEDHRVSSPVKGIVVETFISPGESVFPSGAVVDILDTGSLYVEVFIEEPEMASLRLDQDAGIFPDGAGGREIRGKISYFGKKAEFSPKYIISEKERQALLYKVKVKIEAGQDILKVGMPVTVVFKRKTGQ